MADPIRREMLEIVEISLRDHLSLFCGRGQTTFHDMIDYHMGWNCESGENARGKRLRPFLLLLCTAITGEDWHKALPAALSLEYIHNFTLIHDDIQDNSPERHGRATVWVTYGIPQAINAGNGLNNMAQWTLLELKSSYPSNTILSVAQILNESVHDLINGQILDIEFEDRDDVDIDEYLEMITCKTAVLIKACTQIGVILGSSNSNLALDAANFGLNLGLAYQVLDDLLGIWGDPQKTGKPISSDLLERKKSLPIIFGLQQKGDFAKIWRTEEMKPEIMSSCADLLEDAGAKDFCMNMADEFTQKALTALNKLGGHENLCWRALNSLTLELLSRDA